MPAPRIRTRKVGDLTPDPSNVRAHSEENLLAIMRSLEAFGQQKPIVVDRAGKVLAGNATLEAARRLGWAKIETVETDLEGLDALAYSIADNRTGELSTWDYHALALAVGNMPDGLKDATGFLADDRDALDAIGKVIERERVEKAGPKPVRCPRCGAVQ